jgi:hypothetical protein
MGGEELGEASLSTSGLLGDRAYALIETDTGRVVSAKSVRRFPDVLQCRAAFVEPPHPHRDVPPVRITLPTGETVMSDSPGVDRALSAHFRRDVRLARSAPPDFTIDMYRPDVEGTDAAGRGDTVAPQRLGAAYFADAGLPSPVPPGSFLDLFPVSLLTTSTLSRLTEARPESRFEPRRFRMNVIVATGAPGFPENGWVGRRVSIGDARVRVAVPDARCVMTTLPQGDLPGDPEILRVLVRHNLLELGPASRHPCAGVYAVVEAEGTVRRGDRVRLASGGGPESSRRG